LIMEAMFCFVIPNPESRDSGSGPSDHPGMTVVNHSR
jgi:hypothetical protein